jgi:hypothetical protein
VKADSDIPISTKMLLQSNKAPGMKAEAILHSDSVCLVLENVYIEIVTPLVPVLLIPCLTSKELPDPPQKSMA